MRREGLEAVLAALPLAALTLRGLRACDNRLLAGLPASAAGPSLTALDLRPSLPDVPSPAAVAALARLPALRRLALVRLQAAPLPATSLAPLAGLSGLTALVLSAELAGHRQLVRQLASAAPRLAELRLGRPLPLEQADLPALAPPHLTRLALHITLADGIGGGGGGGDGDGNGSEAWWALSELRCLACLDLTLCGRRRPGGVGALLAALPLGLTALALRQRGAAGLEPPEGAPEAPPGEAWRGADLSHLPRLAGLELGCHEGLSQPLLDAAFSAPASALRALTLASAGSPPGGAPLAFAGLSRLSALTRLCLASPEGVGGDVLAALAALPHLAACDLEVNSSPRSAAGVAALWRLDERALAPLAAGCPRLRHLKLWNAASLTRGGLAALAGLPQLRSLCLLHCPLRAEVAAAALAAATRLRRLTVHGPRLVASRAVLAALAPLTDLGHLSLMNPVEQRRGDMWSGALGTKKVQRGGAGLGGAGGAGGAGARAQPRRPGPLPGRNGCANGHEKSLDLVWTTESKHVQPRPRPTPTTASPRS